MRGAGLAAQAYAARSMRVLVTGASGFVGYAVASLLVERGHEVTGLTRSPDAPLPLGIHRHIGDVREPESLAPAMTRTEGVCHLAALAQVRESRTNPLGYWRANVGGTLALLTEA